MHAIIRTTVAGHRPYRFLGACGCLLLAAAVSFAQPGPGKLTVADVIPNGLRSVPPQKVVSLLKTKPGSEFDNDVIQEDVRRLYETKLFANVKSEIVAVPGDPSKVNVYFLIVEYPSKVTEVVYNGAKHLKPADLDTITGIRKEMPLNPTMNQLARQAILRRYNETGRMFASVDLVEGDKPGDTRVVFNITEGKIVKVSGISFTGVNFVVTGRLRTQLSTSAAILYALGGTYNPLLADADVGKIEEYYRAFGFLDVHVARELKWSENNDFVELIFHVNEGIRYKVKNIDLTGNKIKDTEQLRATLKLKVNDNYDEGVIKVGVRDIGDLYGYDGHLANVNPKPIFDTQHPGEVSVRYEIQEQPAARVGEIRIIGNSVTKQNVILRQVPLFPGQVLTYPDLRLAERNLAKLNIFEANGDGVRPTVTVLENDNSEYKDLLINVQETPTGSLLFGVGVNSDAGLTGSVVLNERNFDISRPPTSIDDLLSGHAWRGGGQEFRAEAVPGTSLQRYTVSFREPFLFDTPNSLSVSGYYFTRQYNEYDEQRTGGRVTVGRRLNDYWTANGGLRIENVNINNVVSFAPEDFQQAVGDNFLLGFNASLQRDTRDNYLRPTEGSNIQFSFEQVVGTFDYPLANIEANKYWTIYQRADGSGRHVLAGHSQVSWAGSHTPVYERYYAGGFRSIRGFEFRGVGPSVGGFELGGDFMFLNSLEYQLPILANDQLYAVAFCDSGTVESKVSLDNYRVTAGAGLRIVVPMLGPVPIALDFGFPIVKADTDRTQVFSFWVGFFH